MAACLAVPVLLGRPRASNQEDPVSPASAPARQFTLEQTLHSSVRPVQLSDAAALVTIALGGVWVAGQLASLVPILPEVLWLTTIVLIVAQIPAIKALTGSAVFGNYLLLLFLASNGARSVIATLVAVGPPVFYYAITTVAIHGVVIFGLGRLARLDVGILAVASQANIGGAASAMALSSARGYSDALLPGVAVGIFGYAVGNYSGFAVAALMRGVLGG